MVIDERDISGYYGIFREIILTDPARVVIRFNAFGNDEIDLEFGKNYKTKEEAQQSVDKYIAASIDATD